MQNPRSQISAYQEQFLQDIVFLLNSRLKSLKQLSLDENGITRIPLYYEIFNVFYHSLYDNLVVTLTWLFTEREKRSLIWYLEKVKESSEVFTKDEIDLQLKEIQNAEIEIKKVKILRDKWIAHRDPCASNNRDKFLSDNTIIIEDIEKLVNLAEDIIQSHFGKFRDAEVDFELHSNNINDLIKSLSEHNELVLFLHEFDNFINKPDFREKLIQSRTKVSILS